MNEKKDLTKKTLDEYYAHIHAKEIEKFKNEYGIIDEGDIVPYDDLIFDKED